MWWRFLMRMIRGLKGAHAWDATTISVVELSPSLRQRLTHDEDFQERVRDLSERVGSVRALMEAEKAIARQQEVDARRQEANAERERDLRWQEMINNERRAIEEAPNVTPWRRKVQ